MSTLPRELLRIRYEKAAEAYLKTLPPEHFMEATPQATQREITLASLSLVRARRTDFHLFNELLIQYPHGRKEEIREVVPDNMVVLHPGLIKAKGSYAIPFQPVRPFWVLEYVSKESQRKDYEVSYHKYERDLKIPYYLIFYPDNQELTLFRHNGKKYVTVKPDREGRCALPEVELEVGILEGWVRYWHRGKLLSLPPDLERQLEQVRQQLAKTERQLEEANQKAAEANQKAAEANQKAAEAERRVEQERLAREALEAEVARLRAEVQKPRAGE